MSLNLCSIIDCPISKHAHALLKPLLVFSIGCNYFCRIFKQVYHGIFGIFQCFLRQFCFKIRPGQTVRPRAVSLGCAQGCRRASSVGPAGTDCYCFGREFGLILRAAAYKGKKEQKLQGGIDLSKHW